MVGLGEGNPDRLPLPTKKRRDLRRQPGVAPVIRVDDVASPAPLRRAVEGGGDGSTDPLHRDAMPELRPAVGKLQPPLAAMDELDEIPLANAGVWPVNGAGPQHRHAAGAVERCLHEDIVVSPRFARYPAFA